MTDRSTFEARFEARLAARAAGATRPFDAAAITHTAELAGKRGRLARLSDRFLPGSRLARPLLVLLVVAFLLLIGAAVLVGASMLRHPQRPPGGIYSTEPVAAPGAFTAIAQLTDGRVLFLSGGDQNQEPEPITGEIYDPASNTFDAVGTMVQGRTSAGAATLDDGRVLIAGGTVFASAGMTPMSTAELFDPRTGAFGSTGSMYEARSGPLAIRLGDGRVLVIGGTTSDGGGAVPDLVSAEAYDPATGTWARVGSMAASRTGEAPDGPGRPTVTLLRDGRVLVAGGDGANGPLATAELFDPRTNSFSATGSMTVGRSNAAATMLADGRVLIVGGDATGPDAKGQITAIASAEVFDPASGRFSASGSLITDRLAASATLLPDGRVLVAGGSNALGQPLSTEFYDPATGAFSLGPRASSTHSAFAALLPDGRVLLDGDQPELFDPAATPRQLPIATPRTDRTFTSTGQPVDDRLGHTATRLPDGRVLIVGGETAEGQVLASAELYDPRSGTFSATGSMSAPRQGHTALLLKDGRVAILGGDATLGGFAPDPVVEAYNPATGQFATLGSLVLGQLSNIERVGAVETPDGMLLIFVAYASSLYSDPSSAIFSFDPDHGTTASVTTIPHCTLVPGDAVLLDGRVILSCLGTAQDFSLQLFNPATAQLTNLEPATDGSTTVLLDGRVVIYGSGPGPVHVLDPTTGTVTAEDDVPGLPEEPTATVLADGRVLFVGGNVAELMDPATGDFLPLPPPLTVLGGQSATLLDDADVLLVGGTTQPADRGVPLPPGAELFHPASVP